MRCIKCDIDLGENYEICPLCASPAADVPPVIEGMKTSEYPEIKALRPFEKRHLIPRSKTFNHYVFLVVALFSALAVFPGIWLLWSGYTAISIVVPVICIIAEVLIFIKSLALKTMRQNAIIYTIPLIIRNAVVAIFAAFNQQMSSVLPGVAISCGLFLLVILRIIEPEKFKVEVQSRFHH